MRPHDLAKSLFLQALEIPAGERKAFVLAECSGDGALRAEVEALLAFHDQTLAGILESPIREVPPERIDGYRVLGELGRGGMGVVYRARRDGGPEVALKVLRRGAISPAMLARFRREAEALARLDHPGIARLIETGIEPHASGSLPWLAMERVEGEDLAAWGRGTRAVTERLETLARIADAVEHAHGHGIVHRDLKPENVLVRPDGRPVVLDFGVARLTDSDVRATSVMTTAGLIVGTIRYMSPEQAEARAGDIGPRSDVYSLGVLAYELLAGRMPYEVPEQSVHRALVAVMTAPPRPMHELPGPFRSRLERLLRAALAKDPRDRLPAAGALAGDLRRIAAGRPPVARARRERGRAAERWRPVLALASGAALLGLVLSSWRAAPTPMDWARGAVQPAATFRRVAGTLDSAAVRLHYTTRTLAREREALLAATRACDLARTIGWRPYGARIGRLARFRRAEAEYLIAERTDDVALYERAAADWYACREFRFPRDTSALPDTAGPSAATLTEPATAAAWFSASMALFDAARIARPGRLLDRAVVLAREGTRALAREAAGAGRPGGPGSAELERDSIAAACRLGVALIGDGYHGANEAEMLAGIRLLADRRARPGPDGDAPSYASLLHELGAGEARLAAIRRDRTLADSALVHLEGARRIRETLEGYTSRVLSRLELAQALRLMARLDPSAGAPRRRLAEAARLLAPPAADATELPPVDVLELGIARSALGIDGCSLRGDTLGLAAIEAELLGAERRLDRSRTPMPALESTVQRARASALRWALTGDPRAQRRAHQAVDAARLTLGNAGSARWAVRLDEFSARLAHAPATAALDYPLPEPF